MKRLFWLCVAFFLLCFLVCIGLGAAIIQLIGELLAGWMPFLIRVVPEVHVDIGGVVTGLVALTGVLLIGHFMARWLWRGTAAVGRARPDWKARWTVSAATIVVLMFVAGIAASGIVHQSVWLATSDQRIFRSDLTRLEKSMCRGRIEQIGMAVSVYAKEHDGRLPDTLDELMSEDDLSADQLICPAKYLEASSSKDQATLLREREISYVYLGRGLRMPVAADRPLACEPLTNHGALGMHILFGDGHVEWVTAPKAVEILGGVKPPATMPTAH